MTTPPASMLMPTTVTPPLRAHRSSGMAMPAPGVLGASRVTALERNGRKGRAVISMLLPRDG